MAVDPKAADEMARLMAIVNNPMAPVTNERKPIAETSNKDAMKVILERFYAASEHAIASPDVATSPELHEALLTSRTDHGVRVGNWEISVNIINEKSKTYDVKNLRTDDVLAQGLLLYEAAHALTKLLNRGIAINTPRIKEVLALEEAFSKHRNDALQFKHKLRNVTLSESVKAVAEDRYNAARDQALRVRNHLRRLNEDLG